MNMKNKRGEETNPTYVIVSIFLVIIVLSAVFFFLGKGVKNPFDFFKNLGFNNTKERIDGIDIIGYNLQDGKLYYYAGVEWILISEEKEAFLGEFRIEPEAVKENLENFYFDANRVGEDSFLYNDNRQLRIVRFPIDNFNDKKVQYFSSELDVKYRYIFDDDSYYTYFEINEPSVYVYVIEELAPDKKGNRFETTQFFIDIYGNLYKFEEATGDKVLRFLERLSSSVGFGSDEGKVLTFIKLEKSDAAKYMGAVEGIIKWRDQILQDGYNEKTLTINRNQYTVRRVDNYLIVDLERPFDI